MSASSLKKSSKGIPRYFVAGLGLRPSRAGPAKTAQKNTRRVCGSRVSGKMGGENARGV